MNTVSPTAVLDPATEALERERRELRAERRAFERFGRRVAALETQSAREPGPGPEPEPEPDPSPTAASPRLAAAAGPSAGAAGGSSAVHAAGCEAVREAYAETVLSLPHYERYDETWLESVAAEFTPDLAAALEGSRLHPQLKRSLLAATEQAQIHRSELLDLIEAERDAVADAAAELSSIADDLESLLAQPIDRLEFNALRLTRTRLEDLRDRCDDLSADRQAQLRRRRRQLPGIETKSFERYLYGTCEHSLPVLAAIATVGRRLERALETVDRSIAGTAPA